MRVHLGALCLLLAAATGASAQDIASTPHNLSTSGTGSVRATSENQICVFCHATHNASPRAPLWNRRDPGGAYTTYDSPSLKVKPGQPTGASRLCLSCHDGTIAMGEVLSRTQVIAMSGDGFVPAGRARLGQDLSDDHPVSFSYQASLAARGPSLRVAPTAGGRPMVDAAGDVQCTSCHDPHDNTFGDFLRADPRSGGLCTKCHDEKGWAASSHATSAARWNGAGSDPWPFSAFDDVSTNACRNCHVQHGAQGRERLLSSDIADDVCRVCHAGTVANADIVAEQNKFSAHGKTTTNLAGGIDSLPDGRKRPAACRNCHNSHQANGTPGTGRTVSGALLGVPGLSSAGSALEESTYQYEVCYGCHSDDADTEPTRIRRVADQANVRRRFNTGNSSYHPIEATGKNPDVPSLKQPYTTGSLLVCTDCHDNDSGPGVGGAGPSGPHGSRWNYLLKLRYDTGTTVMESTSAYALCYDCHERASILNDDSFGEHRKHLRERIPCVACHDPHGIDRNTEQSGDYTHLINFRASDVSPSSNGRLEFIDDGRFKGRCSLRCHGEDHKDENY